MKSNDLPARAPIRSYVYNGGLGAARDRGWPRGVLYGLIFSACTLFGGCVADAGSTWVGTERDSAGVALVHNGLAAGDPVLAVEDLRIAADEARPETLFGYIVDLAVDAAGRIYVLDRLAQAVRVFSPDGEFEQTIGGPGEGPGEFSRFVQSVLVQGDTLLVADWVSRRIQRFGLDGTVLPALRLGDGPRAQTWWSVGADGAIWVRSIRLFTSEEGLWTARDALLRVGEGWATADTALVFSYEPPDLGGPGNLKVPLLVNAPSWTVLSNGSVAWASLREGRVRIQDPEGNLVRIITHDAWAARDATAADGEALRGLLGDKLVALGGQRSALDQLNVIEPERLPTVTSLYTEDGAGLWVQRMGRAADVHPMAINAADMPSGWGGPLWDVLDAEGHHRYTVEFPARFRVMRIRDGHVYGVVRNDLDEEIVVRLVVPEAPGRP